jgi:hypothetical protein
MKSNSHIKFANIFDFSQLHLDSIDWGSTDNRKLQKYQTARRHRSLDWRWQSRLMQCF